jgi:hypothetical protein
MSQSSTAESLPEFGGHMGPALFRADSKLEPIAATAVEQVLKKYSVDLWIYNFDSLTAILENYDEDYDLSY